MATIGVVIATYNGEKYIKEQLNSICNQTQKPNSIIVSDGGSQDNTVNACKKLLENYNDINWNVLESNKQLGITENFEKGLLQCDCDYIFFSDQDDVWKLNKIEIIVQLMNEYNVDVVFTNASITDEKLVKKGNLWNSIGYSQTNKITVYESNDFVLINELLKHNIATGMTMCINKNIVPLICPFCKGSLHDSWIMMVGALSGKIVGFNKEMVFYRQHGNNSVGTSTGILRKIKNRKYYFEKMEQRYEMINELLVRCDTFINDQIRFTILKYNEYLKFRIEFVKNKRNLFWAIMNGNLYRLYEYNFGEILLKDYIVRLIKIFGF